MIRVLSCLPLAALVFAACTPDAETPAVEAPVETTAPPAPPAAIPGAPPVGIENAINPQGWGPLRIGMTRAEVEAAMGPDANPGAVGGPDPDSCTQFRPTDAPEGLLVMIEDGVLTRISAIRDSTVKDSKGLGIGDTAEAVKLAHGDDAKVSPHKYQDAPAEYITVWEDGPRSEPYVEDPAARGIVYEIGAEGKVGAIHAGGPSIQYVEGCL